MSQQIFKNGCWGCLKAQQDPDEKYVCPFSQQHWTDYEKEQSKFF